VRVISYKDLKKARVERTIKEAMKEAKKSVNKVKKVTTRGKGKRSRKRKSLDDASTPKLKAQIIGISEA